MAKALATVAKIIHEVEAGLPLAPGSVVREEDGGFRVQRDARPSRHHFFVDGMLVRVALTPGSDGMGCPNTLFQVWAELGCMPYSIESPERRAKLLAILKATQGLPNARFLVDDNQRIIALHQEEVEGTVTLAEMIYGAVQFMQSARPFAKVIGRYL